MLRYNRGIGIFLFCDSLGAIIMLQDMIAKEDVLAAAEQLKELLPYNEDNVQLMKKALILYRQDSVYRIQVQTPTEISAYVQDVVPVRVTLNLFFMVKAAAHARLRRSAATCWPFFFTYMPNSSGSVPLPNIGWKEKSLRKAGSLSAGSFRKSAAE